MDIGKIYILTNESLPNQYKIGRTINDMKTRIYGYSLMKLDHKFVCIFEEQHLFHSILERFIHGELLESRIRGEYFNFPDDDSAINAVLTSINKFANITEGLTDLEEVKKIAAPKKKKTDSGITSLRMPDGLLRQLTKAAHKCEVSRTEYINQALMEAVAHDLPSPEYKIAWETLQGMYDALEPDILNRGAPNADMRLAAALEVVLPRLRGVE